MNSFLKFKVICKRASEVLDMEEYESHRTTDAILPETEHLIECKNVSATWGFSVQKDMYSGNTEIVDEITTNLKSITLQVKRWGLLGVVGPVGSGKSSLLAMIMGELEITQGHMEVKGKISYVEQEPFICSASIKDNILFGLPFNKEKFDKALKTCWLVEDLQRMDKGIETQIGERGINISGGQKARISLARAVYADSDVYLLDDPLSALDPKVGKQIFDDCICGVLSDKWVVLVTHQVQLLQDVKNIVVIDNGEIVERGSYKELNKTLSSSTKSS